MERNVTASDIIRFAEELEENSSKFYEILAERYPESKEIFLSFSKESKKNKMLIIRTYEETISDALEACFIKGLNLSNYHTEIKLEESMSYLDALNVAVKLEEKACKFYLDAAEKSKLLLATIPMAFKKVAERRNTRRVKLKALLEINLTNSH